MEDTEGGGVKETQSGTNKRIGAREDIELDEEVHGC